MSAVKARPTYCYNLACAIQFTGALKLECSGMYLVLQLVEMCCERLFATWYESVFRLYIPCFITCRPESSLPRLSVLALLLLKTRSMHPGLALVLGSTPHKK